MRRRAPILITGGCGFIGCNLADALLTAGTPVIVVDNLSRPGVESNLDWLRTRHKRSVDVRILDIRAQDAIVPLVARAGAIFHLAAQTAVTTSLDAPREDFEVNALGTFNIIEAIRASGQDIPLIFASTNKVYGEMADVATSIVDGSHQPIDQKLRATGMSESRPLDFNTPYGCSKGVADQYVLDYARSYGLRTAVLRMSCIYGPRQLGTEDQGWVAHFLMRTLARRPITLFGDGKQVRDLLHVGDAVAAYRAVLANIDQLCGQAFNLGGGPENAASLNLVLEEIARITGRQAIVRHGQARQGDQLYFVSDTRRLCRATGWKPSISWREGIADLARWLDSGLSTLHGIERSVA